MWTGVRRTRAGKLPSAGLRFAALAGFALGATTVGCRGPDLAYDCDVQSAAFEEETYAQAQLKGWIGDDGPYEVAITFSEQGINDLLEGLLADNVPFAGDLATGTLNVTFEPSSAPDVEILDDPDCSTCIVYSMSFDVAAASGGGSIASGVGAVQLRIPLELEKRSARDTALVARYDQSEIMDLDLAIFGFDSDEHASLAGALEILMTEEIQERYEPQELMAFGSWPMGEGEVELLARKLEAFPEAGTIQIGLQSNLNLPEGRGFELDGGSLPEGTGMGLSIDTSVFQTMARRMLAEGRIPRLYNEDGNPDPNGNYGATISRIAGRDDGQSVLESTFRVWRIDYGYCGYAEVFMPLEMTIEDGTTPGGLPDRYVDVTAGEIQVVSGAGVGSVAARDEELVAEQEPLIDIFKQELEETLAETLDYGAFDLSGSNLQLLPAEIDVNDRTVEMSANFVVFAQPEP